MSAISSRVGRAAAFLLLATVAADARADGLHGDLEALMETLSVSGREEAATAVVLERLPSGAEALASRASLDPVGNVVVELGEGSPRRLLACGLDEPGLVVSEIREDGFLRVRPVGRGAPGALWVQGFEGQKVWLSTSRGRVAAAVTIPSIHLIQDDRGPAGSAPDLPVGPGDLFVDVGAANAAEVLEQGVRVLDPLGLQLRLSAFGEPSEASPAGPPPLVAGPAAQSKAACAALMAAARGLAAGSVEGALVIAWLRLELWNRKGIESLVDREGPFDQVLLASRGFGWSETEGGVEPLEIPDVGSGPMVTGQVELPGAARVAAHLEPGQAWYTGGPDWGTAARGWFAVPARYRDSPVETVALRDVARLAESLVDWGGDGEPVEADVASGFEPIADPSSEHAGPAALLAEMAGTYGVSTREDAVRRAVADRLPDWARPEVDERGNLLVRVGEGDEHVAFVAHLDEVGFTVDEILADGRLRLSIRGGLEPSAWEGQSAIVHTADGPVRGVFEPRRGWLEAETRRPPEALTVYLGRSSAAATQAAGVRVGDAVTSPKAMRRLGRHRAVARSFDDRVGTTAMLLALDRIDPDALTRRYTFAWVVEEEIGLFGSVALASSLDDLDRVHAVDTFVSSDDPYPAKGFALAPLGEGVVLRAMDNGYLAEREAIAHVQGVAADHGIPAQIGFTGGGNDGIAFLHRGVSLMPLSWPGRYSHSPAEVMDLRDLEHLVDLIVALIEEP